MERDFIGYGPQPPRVEWPGGARLAVSIALNYEEGAEPNPLLGDGAREELTEAVYASVPLGERELIQESDFEYGSRVGHWRVLRLLNDYDVKCSIFAAAYALEQNPLISKTLAERQYDMVGHGYRWVGHYGMSEDAERSDIRECIETIKRLTGRTITGWFTRPPATLDTQRLLAEEGLFWDSTAVNDDLPYYREVAGRPLLIIPYSLDANDTRFWKPRGFVTAADFFEYVRDTFDVLYSESSQTPRMMSIGLHGRIIGRPGRILGLRRLIEHMRSFPDVWFAERSELARIWAEQFAPSNAWNWPLTDRG